MWTPPWARPYALGAFGLAPVEDRMIADKVAAAVAANIAAGRPFYDPVPEEFKNHFQRSARGIYNYLIYSQYMPKALTPSEQEDLAVKVVNKTYYNALRGITGFAGQAQLKGWYYKIARNTLIDELRMFIRSARGREAKATYTIGIQPDLDKGVSLLIEAEAVAAKEDYSETPELFRDANDLVIRLIRAGHDARGREYLSPKSLITLRQWLRAIGNIEMTAKYLGKSEAEAQADVQAALLNLQEARARLERGS